MAPLPWDFVILLSVVLLGRTMNTCLVSFHYLFPSVQSPPANRLSAEGVANNANVVMRVTGSRAHTVIAFSYLLIILYALTLAPICWVYAAEVWSLETRAWGMGIAAIGNWLFNFGTYQDSAPI